MAGAEQHRLRTARLVLVALETRELAARLASDDFTLPFDGLGRIGFGPDHPGELLPLYPLWLAATPHPGAVVGTWTIIDPTAGEALGSIGVKGQPDERGEVEIGYGIIPSRSGEGLATEALAAVVGQLRRGVAGLDGTVTAVVAETAMANLASQHVLRSNGFRQTGERDAPREGRLLGWRLDLR